MSVLKTQKLVKAIAKHGVQVTEQLSEILEGGEMEWSEIHIPTILEHDFGPDYKARILAMEHDAMEAIITSSVFNKMIPKVIRAALRANPKETYVMSNAIPAESKGECEGRYEDHGVFADIQVHEVCELQAGPLYGVATDFQRHPVAKTASAGIAWTREALCKDPNSYLAGLIPQLRDSHDEYRENKLLDAFIGHTPSYDRSGTLYDTYYAADGSSTPFDSGASGPWINSADMDFTCSGDLQELKNLFYDMRDLVHGRPIEMDVTMLEFITSREKADAIRPLLLATAVENDAACAGDATTRHYVMTAEVANGGSFTVRGYQRLIDRIVLRHGVTEAEAKEWFWAGKLQEFLGWVYQIRPEVSRCPIGTEECLKRIVAVYTSLSKGYAYVKNPYKGVMLVPSGSAS